MSGANRKYKDSVFTLLFKDKKNLISLYNALENKNYPLDTEVKINTLDEVFFKNQKNDLSFLIDNKFIVLIEHQSTINDNMPLRLLLYVARLYEGIATGKSIYKERMIKIPTPQFVVLYNGVKSFPKEKIYHLSDAFIEKTDSPQLDLTVKVVNVNHGQNDKLLKKCKPLDDYSIFVSKTREFCSKGMDLGKAIKSAVDYCVKNNVIKNFLLKHTSEVNNMLFEEFNLDEALKVRQEEGWEEGREEGREEGFREGCLKGREEGRAEGRKEGFKDGCEKGRAEGIKQIIENMKVNGFTDEQINLVFKGINQ